MFVCNANPEDYCSNKTSRNLDLFFANEFSGLLVQSSPLRRLRVWQSQVIQNAKHEVVNQLLNALRTMIETWARGNDMGAGA